jgi:hypothetical protein
MTEPARQRGMSTAEYALGTVAVVTGVGALLMVWVDPSLPYRVFWPILEPLIRFILRTFGIAGT